MTLSEVAESEGFEPSIRLLTLYSLSRGAPSAARATLRENFRSDRVELLQPVRITAGRECGKRNRQLEELVSEGGVVAAGSSPRCMR